MEMNEADLAAAAAQAAQDAATIDAVTATLAEHPSVPQVLRDAMPALLRIQRKRDADHADLVATVGRLADLVAQLVPTPAADHPTAG